MLKRITPIQMSSDEYMKRLYENGDISYYDYFNFKNAPARNGVVWNKGEEIFLTTAILKQHSPEFVARVTNRTAGSVRSRMREIFGHCRWIEIATMSIEKRNKLLFELREKLISQMDDELAPGDNFSRSETVELYNFLKECGFNGEST